MCWIRRGDVSLDGWVNLLDTERRCQFRRVDEHVGYGE